MKGVEALPTYEYGSNCLPSRHGQRGGMTSGRNKHRSIVRAGPPPCRVPPGSSQSPRTNRSIPSESSKIKTTPSAKVEVKHGPRIRVVRSGPRTRTEPASHWMCIDNLPEKEESDAPVWAAGMMISLASFIRRAMGNLAPWRGKQNGDGLGQIMWTKTSRSGLCIVWPTANRPMIRQLGRSRPRRGKQATRREKKE